jgi:hypothetical protein
MSKTLWIAGAGVGLTWTSCFGTEINSLASGSVAVSSVVIANGTALDQTADVSFSITGTTPSSGSPYIALYLMPLNQDGTTYGDGTTTGTALPGSNYLVANVFLPLSLTSAALLGSVTGIVIPPGSFKFAVADQTGNSFAASGNAIKYRTYDTNLAG